MITITFSTEALYAYAPKYTKENLDLLAQRWADQIDADIVQAYLTKHSF